MNRTTFVYGSTILIMTMLLFILDASLLSAADRPNRSAPAQVVSEGLNVQQHLERQAELSQRLLGELPRTAAERTVRLSLSPEEVATIDRTSRSSVPLRIGIVKSISPVIEVRDVTRRTFERETVHVKGGVGAPTREGGFVWAAILNSENAGGMRIHIQNMSLPNGVELYLYSRNGQAYGPYLGKGPNGTGEFWTAMIFGTQAIVQFRGASNADVRGLSLKIVDAGLITPNFARGLVDAARPPKPTPGFCGNASCIVDATCYASATLQAAIAKIEWIQGAYIYTCTGGLLSDNNPTQSNFFLTANHCISKNNNAQNANFYWRFATSTCNGSCPSNNGWPYITTGSTVSVTGRKGDFSLLHLNTSPPSGSTLLGWTNVAVANTNGAALKRVSNPGFGPQVYSEHSVDTSAGTCSGWPRGERIYSRDTLGAIDGGSSGSPVLNSNGQVVGQLSGTCGLNPTAVCSSGPGEDNATVDGALAFYYSQVQPIIDP